MAFSLNRVQLIGNLTRDPEMRQTASGQTIATFSVATNFTWTDQSGVRQTKADFHNVVAWRRLAEICGQYLKKGRKVFVEGRLTHREWEGPDGVKRTRTEIVLENMIMLDSGRDIEALGSAPRDANSFDIDQKIVGNALPMVSDPASLEEPLKVADASFSESAKPAKPRDNVEEEVSIDDLPF